jgi:hypothetical protein
VVAQLPVLIWMYKTVRCRGTETDWLHDTIQMTDNNRWDRCDCIVLSKTTWEMVHKTVDMVLTAVAWCSTHCGHLYFRFDDAWQPKIRDLQLWVICHALVQKVFRLKEKEENIPLHQKKYSFTSRNINLFVLKVFRLEFFTKLKQLLPSDLCALFHWHEYTETNNESNQFTETANK